MELIFTKNYDKCFKKIKKHNKEYNNLLRIIELLNNSNNFDEVLNDPIFKMFGLERLKYEYSSFYSFNLNKNGGVIRLIIKPKENKLILYLVHISYDHYKDFTIERGEIDEE